MGICTMNIEERKVLEIITGSNLYGTNSPSSDKDYMGIFIPTLEYYFGLHKVEEQDCSITSKHENGRNTSEAVDRKFYEIKKYFKLALNSSPNILELLFVPKDKIIYIDKIGQCILDNKDLFPSQLCKKSFLGYTSSQKHNSWRSEGILKYGMNYKSGSHLIRLLYECKELLEDGKITFPLKERSLILDIKEEKYKPKEVIALAEELEKEIDEVKTVLPKTGNFKKAEKLLLDLLQTKFSEENNEI
jgi:uncharacterized protein